MTKDFFALSVLDPLLISDESARLYQKLVRDDRLAISVVGAFNFLEALAISLGAIGLPFFIAVLILGLGYTMRLFALYVASKAA